MLNTLSTGSKNNPTAPEVGMIRCKRKHGDAIATDRCASIQSWPECRGCKAYKRKSGLPSGKFPYTADCKKAGHHPTKTGKFCKSCQSSARLGEVRKEKMPAPRQDPPAMIQATSPRTKELERENTTLRHQVAKLEARLKEASDCADCKNLRQDIQRRDDLHQRQKADWIADRAALMGWQAWGPQAHAALTLEMYARRRGDSQSPLRPGWIERLIEECPFSPSDGPGEDQQAPSGASTPQ